MLHPAKTHKQWDNRTYLIANCMSQILTEEISEMGKTQHSTSLSCVYKYTETLFHNRVISENFVFKYFYFEIE